MKKYRYVIICSNGCSQEVLGEEEFIPYGLTARKRYDLPELLRKGWQPVRETPMGGSGNTWVGYSLILLEKEAADGQEVPEVKPV